MTANQTLKCNLLQILRPILVLDAVTVVISLVEFAAIGSGVVVFRWVFRRVEGSLPVEGEKVGQLVVNKVDGKDITVWFSPEIN